MVEKNPKPKIRLIDSNGKSLVVSTRPGWKRPSSSRGGMSISRQKIQPVQNLIAKLSDQTGTDLLSGVQHEPMLLARLSAEEAEYGKASAKLLETLRSLGLVYCLKGAYNLAEAYFKRALEVLEGDSEEEMAERRDCLSWLISYVYVPQAKFDDARECAEEFASQGGADEDVFNAFNNVCAIAYGENNVTLAFECIRHALPFAKQFKMLQPESLAKDFHNAAGLALELGMLDAACSYMKQALALRENALGTRHVLVIDTMRTVADLLRRLGRPEEALGLALECHHKWFDVVGRLDERSPSFTMLIAQIYGDLAREFEADRFYDETITIEEALGGFVSEELLNTLEAYRDYCKRTRRMAKAAAIEERLASVRRYHGSDD